MSNHKIIETEYKKITMTSDVTISHNIANEYSDNRITNCSLPMYYSNILKSYSIAETFKMCDVVSSYYENNGNVSSAVINIKMPRYSRTVESLFNVKKVKRDSQGNIVSTRYGRRKNLLIDEKTFYNNMVDLFEYMNENDIFHANFELSNIGIDEDESFQLLSLCHVRNIPYGAYRSEVFESMITKLGFITDQWSTDPKKDLKHYVEKF